MKGILYFEKKNRHPNRNMINGCDVYRLQRKNTLTNDSVIIYLVNTEIKKKYEK